MSQIITGINQIKILNALDTYNHTTLNSGPYIVKVDMFEIPPSGLSVVIKQNGTTKASSVLPASSQQLVSLQILLECSLSDVIGVVLSSAVGHDALPNQIKGSLNIHQGVN